MKVIESCLAKWPALMVNSNQTLTAGQNVKSSLITLINITNSFQVQFNNWPLYYWIGDNYTKNIITGNTIPNFGLITHKHN